MAIPTGPEVFKMTPKQLYEMIREQGAPQTEYEKALTLAFLVIAKRVEKLAKMVVEHDQLIFGDDKEEAAAPGGAAAAASSGGDKTPFPAGAAPAPNAPPQPNGAAQGEITPEQEAELVGKARGAETAAPPPPAAQKKPAQNGSGKAAQS